METIELPEGVRLIPAGWPETRAFLKPLFDSREFWTIFVCGLGVVLLDEIREKYYADDQDGKDFAATLVFFDGHPFMVAMARKRKMLAWQFSALLRRVTRVKVGERELLSKDVQFAVPSWAYPSACQLYAKLFDHELAVAA
jgi:hypothetical protein